jgi:hypothetical protein
MVKYLLMVMGDFKSDEICQDIALTMSPIVDSPNLKFQYNDGLVLLHFASEVSKEEIEGYIVGVFYGISNKFILTELTDNVSVIMPEDVKNHLLDLDNADEDISSSINIQNTKPSFEFGEEEEDDDFVALLLGELRSKVKAPSLDQILDKINNNGLESITQFEKDILDGYSKN